MGYNLDFYFNLMHYQYPADFFSHVVDSMAVLYEWFLFYWIFMWEMAPPSDHAGQVSDVWPR